VSIEFNLLYRWHATASEADTAWTEKRFSEVMGGADPRRVIYISLSLFTSSDSISRNRPPWGSSFRRQRGRLIMLLISPNGLSAGLLCRLVALICDTYAWNYSLTREHGRFRDEDLARILQNATEAPAGAYKARGTPEVLRIVELLSIEQGRAWGACTVSILRFIPALDPGSICCLS
jgi:linoleate 10R-lipoxygenase